MSRRIKHAKTNGDQITVKGSTYVLSAAMNASGTSYNPVIPPLFGPTITSLADEYSEFRVCSMAVSINNMVFSTTVDCAVAVICPEPRGTPGNRQQLAECPGASILFGGNTITQRHVFGSNILMGNRQVQWFNTEYSGTVDNKFETQGVLMLATVGSDSGKTFYMKIDYTIQFRNRQPSAITMERRLLSLGLEVKEHDWADLDEAEELQLRLSHGASGPNPTLPRGDGDVQSQSGDQPVAGYYRTPSRVSRVQRLPQVRGGLALKADAGSLNRPSGS